MIIIIINAHYCDYGYARMSNITNDGLTRSGPGCFMAAPISRQWASKR